MTNLKEFVEERTSTGKGKRKNPSRWITVEGEPGSALFEAIDTLRAHSIDDKKTVEKFIIGLAKELKSQDKKVPTKA